ncbi:MAG: hypothetical protein HYS27_23675 [Deltaproteobacteria bacterium]|nr:hypothetical protein [Deltaproteobacteria bacterium]
MTTQPGNTPELFVLSMRRLTVTATGNLRFTGSRSVVLVVFGDATIDGVLDVSGRREAAGPGGAQSSATFGDCIQGAGGAAGNAMDLGGAGGGGGAPGVASPTGSTPPQRGFDGILPGAGGGGGGAGRAGGSLVVVEF